ncbi:conserved hypothetical protein [Paraburkholderia ribeironis]|uniref:UPF0391 membrane protein BN2475_180038 n=2 Tax=Paraburkholderia ribeironis TaxID=1247936 RepID=A0A1N7RUU5_9BURK|nr:conserved hypothetical protein [Paraburkholderia ribeironis]
MRAATPPDTMGLIVGSLLRQEDIMLRWALFFAIVAVIAGVLGFTGIAAGAAAIAKFLFVVFVILCVVFLVLGFVAMKKIID